METGTRTKWGQARFGSGRVPAMAVALPSGLLLGAGGGWLAVATGVTEANPVLGFWVFAFCLTMPATLLVYVAIVDRNTIEGAVERPDDSIEAGWQDKAASRSFTDLILILGVAGTVVAFLPGEITVNLKLVLPAVLILCAVLFGVRYLLQRRKG
ncbi:hypothetical protein [Arthrobacter sunyaminii]|uniref:hypothetical protein n=1 Tax=Arthrobacter sunyaminii TaxID=2816859 RepID=UPI001F3E136C|nr:hypothetical protein [Arthrobacter sunyaminii]